MNLKTGILIVEDEPILALDLQQILENFGYSVVASIEKGEHVLPEVWRCQPELVLMDVQLRGEYDGIQTAQSIRETMDIPVVYLSAYADDVTLARAKETQPYGYLTKPFKDAELHSTIQMALYKHAQEKKARHQQEILYTIYQGMTDGIITLSDDWIITFSNNSAVEMLGSGNSLDGNIRLSELELRNADNPDELIDREYIEGISILPHTILVKDNRGRTLECTINYASNTLVGTVIVFRDITLQKEIERSQAFLSAIVENSNDAIISCDFNGTITSWNTGACRLFLYERDEIIGQNISLLTPAFSLDEVPLMFEEIANGVKVEHYETLRKRRDGSLLSVSLTISPICSAHGTLIGLSLIARDITEKKQLERELIEIASEERQRIGQELHDSICQQLVGIGMKMSVVSKRLEDEEHPLSGTIREISGFHRTLVNQTRALARGLVPLVLRSDGIIGALQELVAYIKSMYDMEAVLYTSTLKHPIPEDVTNQFFRIAQEAVQNAAKHSKATKIDIHLIEESTEFQLHIQDNGVGFDPLLDAGGIGLRLMRYRASIVGAHLEVFSTEHSGTTVVCRVPFSES